MLNGKMDGFEGDLNKEDFSSRDFKVQSIILV